MSATDHTTQKIESSPIAIVGMGCLFPGARNVQEFWRLICEGRDCIGDVPETHWSSGDYFDADPKTPDKTYCARGGFLPTIPFDPTEFGIPPTILEATDTTQLLSLVAAKAALEDAGYDDGRDFRRDRVSVIVGVTGTQELVLPLSARLGHPIWRKALADAGIEGAQADEIVDRIADGYVPWQENSFPGLLGNVVAGRISNRLNLQGTNCAVDAACASSLSAVHMAMMELQTGRCDLAVAGGADTLNDIFMYMCFSKTPALSPTGDARPFSANADGTVLGEGVAFVTLKRLDDAERDGDRVYAVIRAIGTSSDGRSQSIYAPHAAGQERCLRDAYARAGVAPASIELIEAHGTGTKVGDATEFEAINAVFGSAGASPGACAIGSIKSQIGHTKAAAGVAGLMKAALSVYHGALPPTIKVDAPNPKMQIDGSPFHVNTVLRPWLGRDAVRRAGVSAFGFGGSNYHAVIESSRQSNREPAWDGSVQIIALSAARREEIAAQLDALRKKAADPRFDAAHLAYAAQQTRHAFDVSAACRLIMVVNADDDLTAIIDVTKARLQRDADAGDDTWLSDRAAFGRGAAPGRLALLFPGQGSQTVNMARRLACLFPELREAIRTADALLRDDGLSLRDAMYPKPFGAHDCESLLTRTDVAQPALGAIGLGLTRVLARFGVRPDATAGHSYGELLALHAAGRIDAPTLLRLSRLRGRLMADCDDGRGAMLAVRAAATDVESMLRDEHLDVVLANRNGPAQVVLSGERSKIAAAAEACNRRGFGCVPLRVAGAFHSPLVAGALSPFRNALASVEFEAGSIPVYSNTTAQAYPADSAASRTLLAEQLARPVDFAGSIERMSADGISTFIEIGPKAVLSKLVGEILSKRRHAALAIDASGGATPIRDLALVLARLAAAGHAVDLRPWEAPVREPRTPRMVVPLNGANIRTTPRKEIARIDQSRDRKGAEGVRRDTSVELDVKTLPMRDHRSGVPSTYDAGARQPSSGNAGTAQQNALSENNMQEAPMSGHDQDDRPSALPEAIRLVQQGLSAMQLLQQQTAEAHMRFLAGQEQAQRAFQAMLESQHRLVAGESSAVGGLETRNADDGATAAQVTKSRETPISAVPSPPRAAESRQALSESPQPTQPTKCDSTKIAPPPVEAKPTPQPVAPRQTPTMPTTGAWSRERIGETVVGVVCDKTGYPAEMIDLAMDLEADLGVDSIKRVEIVAALEEAIPEFDGVQPDHMGSMRTLAQIVDFIAAGVGQRDTHGGADVTAPAAGITAERPAIANRPSLDELETAERQAAVDARPTDDARSATGGVTVESLSTILLDVIAELTGYPPDMLELGMDMEADLGIDSIKRVEILAAVESRLPDMPPVKPEQMGAMRTLAQIVEYFAAEAGLPATSNAPPSIQTPVPAGKDQADTTSDPQPTATDSDAVADSCAADSDDGDAFDPRRRVLGVATLPPVEARRLPVADEHEIWVTDDGDRLSTALVAALESAGRSVRLVSLDPSFDVGAALVGGLIIVAPPTRAIGSVWEPATEELLKRAFEMLKALADPLLKASVAGGALVATVTRMDGAFGLADGDFDPAQGGLAGLAKTAMREWDGVTCRALDVAIDWNDAEGAAQAVVRELSCGGPVEVGLDPTGRRTVDLSMAEVEPGAPAIARGDVVVVTGGARGVTAEAALALARRFQPTLVLMGRTTVDEREADWLNGLTDEREIKQAIKLHAFAEGEKPKPQDVKRVYRDAMAQREIRENLRRIRTAGSDVRYLPVDVCDAAAVRESLERVQRERGTIRGVIHGAGRIEDKRIRQKTSEQFAAVLDTKVSGLRHVLDAVDLSQLRHVILFSSVSGRCGNIGQIDYAMANEVLNKVAQRLARRLPNCRVVSMNWGPWDGGMVTPGLKREFENHGVELIPLDAGAELVADELSNAADGAVEIVLGHAFDMPAGAGAAAAPSTTAFAPHLAFDRDVSVATHSFLASHVIDGRAVLPAAMMIEWLAHAALHANPGLRLQGMDNFRLLKGVVFDDDARRLRFIAAKAVRSGDVFDVPVELRSVADDGAELLHARATVVLTAAQKKPGAPAYEAPAGLLAESFDRSADEIYSQMLFHGAALAAIERIDGIGAEGLVAAVGAGASPDAWMTDPLRSDWVTNPLGIDAAFQAAIVWCRAKLGAPSLPAALVSYRQYRDWAREGVSVAVEVRQAQRNKMVCDIHFVAAGGELVARISGYECTVDANLARVFERRHLAPAM